jgi:hypothetical protein
MVLVLTFLFSMFTEPALPAMRLQQAKEKTPISELELTSVLQEAHMEVFGKPASKSRLSVAWAQIAFENARGTAVFNHNLGNVGPGRLHPYYKQGPARFRSFKTFQEGARVYWEHLRDKCSAAMASFDAMNAQNTAYLLRRCGYHRTEIDLYARGLNGLMWTGLKLASDI